jgi:hypothetical protein
MRCVLAALLTLTLAAQSTASWAGSASNESTPLQVAYGAGSALGTFAYAPFKATFCILGGIGSAFTAIVSPPTASKVVGASCRGTWAIAPGVLRGNEQVKFVGDVPAATGGEAEQ